jgi:hypothetical protein
LRRHAYSGTGFGAPTSNGATVKAIIPLTLFLAAAPMVPLKTVADALLVQHYRLLVATGPFADKKPIDDVTLTELELPFWKGTRVVLATGSTDGGHRSAPVLFAVDSGDLRVLEAVGDNLDRDGYRRSVTELRSCTVAQTLQRRLDLPGAMPCKGMLSTLAGAPPEAVAGLLSVALGGIVPEVEVSSPGLLALLEGRPAPNTRWTLPEAKLEPFTVDAKQGTARGMVEGRGRLLRVTLELKGGNVRFEQEELAFVQHFIR